VHFLLTALATTPAPAPSPSLRPGVTADQVTPGLLGFLLTAFIVVLTALLIVDMVRRIRRVRYRAQVEEERAAAAEAALGGGAPADGYPADGAPADGYPADGAPGRNALPDATFRDATFRDAASRKPEDGAATRPEVNGDAGPGNR
jgi:hypothetical protein